jgi:pimeloyl-ACP methyl ester carboxylesterase
MRTLILLLAAGLAITSPAHAAEQLYTEQPMLTPALAAAGKWPVGVTTMTASNPGQISARDFTSLADRNLILEVWYPAVASNKAAPTVYENVTRSHQPFTIQGAAYRDLQPANKQRFPLIVLSHGYTGYRTIMFYLGEHLASHGYVVVGIDHTDSTNADVDFATAPGGGFPSTLLNRARDQQFVLDYFAGLDGDLGRMANTEQAAIIGYSMGGYGAVNTVGGCYSFTPETFAILKFPEQIASQLAPLFNSCNGGRPGVDPRWKAMIAIAPWGQELGVHAPEHLDKLTVPAMYIAGEFDDISGYEHGVKKLYEQTGSKSKYMLVYKHARHNIGPHPAPKIAHASEFDLGHYIEPSWSNEMINRINKHMGLAFIDCHVKGLDASCDYLPPQSNITQQKLPTGKFTPAWPGFNERWGTGIEFYRAN